MRAGAALGLLLAVALAVDASLLMQQTVTATPNAKIPVVFQANGGMTTVLGTNATNATVNGVSLLLSSTVNTLRIIHNVSLNWSMQLKVVSATGLSGVDLITLGLKVDTTTQTVALTSGTSYPQTTGAVTLPLTGPDGNVTALSSTAIVGGCGGVGSCSFVMQVLFAPPGATSPALIYSYTLNVL